MGFFKKEEVQSLLFNVTDKNKQIVKGDANDLADLAKLMFEKGEDRAQAVKSFAQIVIETADQRALDLTNETYSMLAEVVNAGENDSITITKNQNFRGKIIQVANGSTVRYHRLAGQDEEYANPTRYGMGVQFERKAFFNNAVTATQKFWDNVINSRYALYQNAIYTLSAAGVASGVIPAKNKLTGSNTTIANYNDLSAVINRTGKGGVIAIGDEKMGMYYFSQIAGHSSMNSNEIKNQYAGANVEKIGRTTFVPVTNPFTDKTNTKTQFPVNIMILINSGDDKPFGFYNFGTAVPETDYEYVTGRVRTQLNYLIDMRLNYGQNMGYIKEDSVNI